MPPSRICPFFNDLAERHIHGFNRVGRINSPADVGWIGKKWGQIFPVFEPGLANTGVSGVPFIGKFT